jgi:hypothetical protein
MSSHVFRLLFRPIVEVSGYHQYPAASVEFTFDWWQRQILTARVRALPRDADSDKNFARVQNSRRNLSKSP